MIPNSSDAPRRGELRIGEALLFFFLLVPIVFLGGTLFQSWSLTGGTLLMEWGLILLPTYLYLRRRRKDIRKILRLSLPSPRHLLGSLILSASLVPLVAEVAVLQDLVIPIPEDLVAAMKDAFTVGPGESILLAFVAFSVTPAVCEEVLFRGFLLSGLASVLGERGAVVMTGILFGLFHLNLYRFAPTAIIGIVIGLVVLASSSLATGILSHAVNNAIALAILNLSWLRKYPWLLEERHIPLPVLLICALLFLCGALLLRAGNGPEKENPAPERSS
jgi:membrane protease YdiL (CAAX protease family)